MALVRLKICDQSVGWRAETASDGEKESGAVSTDILHFPARVAVMPGSDAFHRPRGV